MKKAFLLLCAVLLSGQTLLGVPFLYVDSTFGEQTTVKDSNLNLTIEVKSESPESLRIFGTNYLLDTPIYSFMTGSDSWEEHYYVEAAKRTVTLCKSLSQGLTEIRTSNYRNQVNRFRPAEGERIEVTYMPPVFISLVEFANMKENGTVISDYGSPIGYKSADHVNVRMEYQAADGGRQAILDARIVDKRGNPVRDKKFPKGYTASIPVAATTDGTVRQQIGAWKLNAAEKGWRMEFYADNRKICSIAIPVRGEILYKPIIIKRLDNKFGEVQPFQARGRLSEPRRATDFWRGNTHYMMLSYEEVEM